MTNKCENYNSFKGAHSMSQLINEAYQIHWIERICRTRIAAGAWEPHQILKQLFYKEYVRLRGDCTNSVS